MTASAPGAAEFIPDDAGLDRLTHAVQACRGCELYRDATQAVFGRGSPHAKFMLLGEQPGDSEDRRGEPFVGPAGRLLDRALEEAGVAAADAYVTNAVKHFRWRPEPRGGKRRIHQRPEARHVSACRPWWIEEARLVRPQLLVALGATAGQALFGSSFRVGSSRGTRLEWPVPEGWGEPDGAVVPVVATVHPSAVLRDPERDSAFNAFVTDLRVAAEILR